jgi:hypothetical protein
MRLASLGHSAEFDDLNGVGVMRKARANPPEAFVIDLSRLPSHGREVALSIRSSKNTRAIPIVFVGGEPEKVERLKSLLPDATYTTWGRLKTALPRAMRTSPARPVAPKDSLFAGKPTIEKLGVKDGMRVALLGAPSGFAKALEPWPPQVGLSAKADATTDIALCVARSRREMSAHFAQVAAQGRAATEALRQTMWAVWPKKASGIKSDLDGNVVREMGLAAGWVDFKICSIDETWSGLAFKRRR